MGAEEFYISLVWVCQKVICNSCNDNLAHFRDLQSLITSVRNELTASIAQLREDFNASISALTTANAEQHSDLSTNQRNERERATVDGILSASDPSTQLISL
ncbi:hypothetical protein Trydic_g4373 [Trypoxylus dichotomus]